MYKNTISDHYTVGNGSYNTPFDFPKDTEQNFKSETKILKVFKFLSKKYSILAIFNKKLKNLKVCVSKLKSRSVSFGKSKGVL